MKNILFLFLSISIFVDSINSQLTPEEIYTYSQSCNPTPICIDLQTKGYINQACKGLEIYPGIENATGRKFKCCEVSMKKKKNGGNSIVNNFTGCIAVMSSYVDDDRYEDIIDYFERGKQYKLRNYFIMLGLRLYNISMQYISEVNLTKYDVDKFDCFAKYNEINIFFILAILILIY